MSQSTFKRNAHAAYFSRCLRALPSHAQSHDSNRVTIAFFCLAGLELLGKLDPSDEQRAGWIEWLWSLQAAAGGFRGYPCSAPGEASIAPGHLPSTYTALACLAILRAPLDRLDRTGLRTFLAACQTSDGSFSPTPNDSGPSFQNDLRMSYCAAVVASFVGSSFDIPLARQFVARCKTWEGGYSAKPGIEAQGGTTYCAVSALSLLGGRDTDASDTIRYLVQRQIGGFQGRPGKLEDVCYSFWCGGALATLGEAHLVEDRANTAFLLDAQSAIGGFGKEPDDFPDPYHSYLALAALALTPVRTELDLAVLDSLYNMTTSSRAWIVAEIERLAEGE